MKFIFLVFASLKRKKLRTLLTGLSIFVAFLLFGALCAIKDAFLAGVNMAGADRLMVHHKVSFIQPLPQSYAAKVAAMPGVDAICSFSWFGGIYQDPKNFISSMAVEPEELFRMYPEYVIPEDQKKAWLKTRTGAVVGRTAAEKYHWKIGDRVPFTSPIWGEPAGQPNWEFEIVGIYDGAKKSTDKNQFFLRYDYFDESRDKLKGRIGWLMIRIKDPDRAAEIAKRIDEEFANSPDETKAEPESAMAASFVQQIGDIGTIVTGVIAAVFFTILLVAGNTVSQSVRERTEEIGVLKAMGFPSGLVLTLVLAESCLIALLGGLAGLGAAWLITLGGSPVPNMLPTLDIPYRDLVTGAALALGLGLLSGAIPAIQAMRLQIATALRRNG